MPLPVSSMPFPMPPLVNIAIKDTCAINTFKKLLHILLSEVYCWHFGFTTLLLSATTTDMSLYEILNLFPRWPLLFRSFLPDPLVARDVVTPFRKWSQKKFLPSMFLLTRGKCASTKFNVWERSFWNLFPDSRTPLDSIRDKLVTLIHFVIVQCPSVWTTWYAASCTRNGYTWAVRDLRQPQRARVALHCLQTSRLETSS